MATGQEREEARQRARDLAWAEALGGLSRVAATLSSRLREVHDENDHPARSATLAAKAPSASPVPARLPRGGFGPRQTAVLALGGLDRIEGLSASEVAATLGLQVPNTHTVLKGLEKLELIARVPGARPMRWRRPAV